MPARTERILVSHAGALPRPDALQRLFDAGPGSQDVIDAALPGAVTELVGRQAAVGVDIVGDGEISKRGLFTGYIRDRMTGFEAEAGGDRPSSNAGVTGRDRRDFPGFFAAGLGGFDFKGAMPAAEVTSLATGFVCTGPLRYTGRALVQADIDRLTAAAGAHNVPGSRSRAACGHPGGSPAPNSKAPSVTLPCSPSSCRRTAALTS